MRTIVSAVLLCCTFGMSTRGAAQAGVSTTPDRIDSLLDHEQWVQAIAALDQRIAATPSPVLLSKRARAYRESGNAGKSRQDYDAALRLDSTFAAAYVGRAATRLQLADPSGALDDLARARRLGLTAPPLLLIEGMAHGQLEHAAEALTAFDRYVRATPTDPQGWYYRGFTHGRAGRHSDAIADYTRAIALKMGGATVYRYRAMSHLALEQIADACVDGTEAAKRGDAEAAELVQQYCRKK